MIDGNSDVLCSSIDPEEARTPFLLSMLPLNDLDTIHS